MRFISVLSFLIVFAISQQEPLKIKVNKKWCAYGRGTCIIQADGSIECTGKSMNDFTYPNMAHPNGEKYVGLTCAAADYNMCALTESGKFRCWMTTSEDGTIPQYSEGDIAASNGQKFVWISLSNTSGRTLAAIREDGVMELWGDKTSNNSKDKDAVAAGIASSDGKTRTGVPPNYIAKVDAGKGALVWLESDGSIHVRGSYEDKYIQYLEEVDGAGETYVNVWRGNIVISALKSDGSMTVIPGHTSYIDAHNRFPSNGGTKFVEGGCAGHIDQQCHIVDDGHVECWDMNRKLEDQDISHVVNGQWAKQNWVPATGSPFVECVCGTEHTCCLREDGGMECLGRDEDISVSPPEAVYNSAPAVCTAEIEANAQLTADLETKVQEVAALNADVQTCTGEKNQLNSDLQTKTQEVAALTADVQTCTQEKNQLSSDLQAKEQELVVCADEKAQMETSRDLYKQRFMALQDNDSEKQQLLTDPVESSVGISELQNNPAWKFTDILERFGYLLFGAGLTYMAGFHSFKNKEEYDALL